MPRRSFHSVFIKCWSIKYPRRVCVCSVECAMKKVFKFVKGKKETGTGITPSQSRDLSSPAQTPEDERFLSLDHASGYIVDFCGKDKTLTKLHKAAWQGHLEKLKTAMKKVEIDAVDRHNRSALHFAVSQGHPNIVWFLLGNNAKMTICDDDGCTPLLKAVECGHKDCMTLLLERGADINNTDYQGNSGLHLAAKQGNLDIASALLTRGAVMDMANNTGEYPLHIATRSQNKDLVELFLRSKASANVCDRENRTPLMLAAKTGNLLLTQLFFEYGADLSVVDSNGWTAEDYALLGGHEAVANELKSFAKSSKAPSLEICQEGDETARSNEESSTWNDESDSLHVNKNATVIKEDSRKEKEDELSDSPNLEAMPPPCQPPRSWEMIQAGMIDSFQEGSESKRLSITALGTLHSRRESFTEAQGDAAKYTLSLNRRKGVKRENSFAKQRLSFNEEESLKSWITDSSATLKEIDKMGLDNILKVDGADSISAKLSANGGNCAPVGVMSPLTESSLKRDTPSHETFNGTEEVWVANAQVRKTAGEETNNSSWDSEELHSQEEANFPPPPSGIELGVNMAKSIGCMKGISIDHPVGNVLERNTRIPIKTDDASKDEHFHGRTIFGGKRHARHESISSHKWRSEEVPQSHKYADRLVDVNRRINEQLQCYDQALKELAETPYAKKQEVIVSALEKPSTAVNYYSLPASKHRTTAQNGEQRGSYYYDWSKPSPLSSGPQSLPFSVNDSQSSKQQTEKDITSKTSKDPVQEPKKSKRHMLLAMRDVKHAVQVANSFKTSVDDQILSPLAKPPDTSDSDSEPSPKEREQHFFRSEKTSGRQETVIERPGFNKSSSSEEPTLWLQDKNEKKEGTSSLGSTTTLSGQGPPTPKLPNGEKSEPGSIRDSPSSDRSRKSVERADDESRQVLRDIPSPDISFSSGPIEGGKDSGSDVDTSHNDVSPTHNYTLQTHHEWLKNHLKTATTEKNRLEQMAVELSEKAERLQYELADAKEATKSKDEVIHLLQSQLSRMELAYTKSLEESVQSRLEMTTHEQEILHLKELCFRYEEEKERMGVEGEENELVELKSRIRVLEEEKDKLMKDVLRLEQEKGALEKRLQEATASEIIDQCQKWKERFENLEESAKANDEAQTAYLTYLKSLSEEHREREAKLVERNAELEKMLFEAKEKNAETEARLHSLLAETESEKFKNSLRKELAGPVSEISRKSVEMEAQMRRLEKDVEGRNLSIIREKEEEMQKLIKQFAEEREALIKSYERRIMEKSSEENSREREDSWKKENERLKKTIKLLQEQFTNPRGDKGVEISKGENCQQISQSVKEIQGAEQEENEKMDMLEKENLKLKWEINELQMKLTKDDKENADYKGDLLKVIFDHTNAKSEVTELKNQMQGLEETLSSERKLLQEYKNKNAGLEEQIMKIAAEEKQTNKYEGSLEVKQSKRRGAGRDDELAWTNLYGIKRANKSREGCDFSSGEGRDQIFDFEKNKEEFRQKVDANFRMAEEKKSKQDEQSSEFLELKSQIFLLQNKMVEEKSTRTNLEKKLSEMEAELRDKERLEQEIAYLRRKMERDYVPKSEMEVVKHEMDLERRRNRRESLRDTIRHIDSSDYKTKCERFAMEIEKSKEIRRRIEDTSKEAIAVSQESKEKSTSEMFHGPGLPSPGIRFPSMELEPEIKSKLNDELEKSIKKHMTDIGIATESETELFKNNLLQ